MAFALGKLQFDLFQSGLMSKTKIEGDVIVFVFVFACWLRFILDNGLVSNGKNFGEDEQQEFVSFVCAQCTRNTWQTLKEKTFFAIFDPVHMFQCF